MAGLLRAPAESLIAAQVQIALRVRGGLTPALGASGMDTSGGAAQRRGVRAVSPQCALPLVPRTTSRARHARACREARPGLSTRLARPRPPLLHGSAIRHGDPAMMERYDAAMERALSLDPNLRCRRCGSHRQPGRARRSRRRASKRRQTSSAAARTAPTRISS